MNPIKQSIHLTPSIARRFQGAGITTAVMDTGIAHHLDFDTRILAFYDCLHHRRVLYDDNGHGTHISGIIAGNGTASSGLYCGIAPKSNLVSIKILDRRGNGNASHILEGIDWIIAHRDLYNIRIINISVGTLPSVSSDTKSILVEGVEKAWDAGIVVVTAAGNNGPGPMTITTPGISPKVITVGTADWNTTDSYGRKTVQYSGRGPTCNCIMKPEIVAPGTNIVSCSYKRNGYIMKSGTSMATPVVSGAIALLLEKYPYFSPKDVKLRLHDTARDLGLPINQQGWGMLQLDAMLGFT